MLHKSCSEKFSTTPGSFLNRGSRCPRCRRSKGETLIEKILSREGVNYKTEQTFKDLKSPKGFSIRYDFSILVRDEIKGLIEYDSEFHYNDYGLADTKKIQLHDSIKNNYAESNKIPILRIPYWEFKNTENILLGFLKEVI